MADNNAKNIQYLEVSEQRSASSEHSNGSFELSGGYLSKKISIFGKIFIAFMILIFISSFVFLAFSYTSNGVDFLRSFKIEII